MSFAFPLHDYRIFCADCNATCDVRAIDETDAEREALKVAWLKNPRRGLLCPLCVEYDKRAATRNLSGTIKSRETA